MWLALRMIEWFLSIEAKGEDGAVPVSSFMTLSLSLHVSVATWRYMPATHLQRTLLTLSFLLVCRLPRTDR